MLSRIITNGIVFYKKNNKKRPFVTGQGPRSHSTNRTHGYRLRPRLPTHHHSSPTLLQPSHRRRRSGPPMEALPLAPVAAFNPFRRPSSSLSISLLFIFNLFHSPLSNLSIHLVSILLKDDILFAFLISLCIFNSQTSKKLLSFIFFALYICVHLLLVLLRHA